MQINYIIQQKDRIINHYAHGATVDMKYPVPHDMPSPNIDHHGWEFLWCQSKNIPVNGPMLKAEAMKALLKFKTDTLWPHMVG